MSSVSIGLQADKFLKEGTILVPKPEYLDFYKKVKLLQYVVTKEDEIKNATIGDRWMIINKKNT